MFPGYCWTARCSRRWLSKTLSLICQTKSLIGADKQVIATKRCRTSPLFCFPYIHLPSVWLAEELIVILALVMTQRRQHVKSRFSSIAPADITLMGCTVCALWQNPWVCGSFPAALQGVCDSEEMTRINQKCCISASLGVTQRPTDTSTTIQNSTVTQTPAQLAAPRQLLADQQSGAAEARCRAAVGAVHRFHFCFSFDACLLPHPSAVASTG